MSKPRFALSLEIYRFPMWLSEDGSCSWQINIRWVAIKKFSVGLEIAEQTAAFVHRPHLYLSEKRRPHNVLLCECVRKAVCQPELILHPGSLCLCSTPMTSITHCTNTSHPLHQRLVQLSGQQITGTIKNWGNMASYEFVAGLYS